VQTHSKFGDTTLAPGVWTHVAAVIRGLNDIDLYVGGVDDGGTYGGIGPTTNVVYLGGDAAIGRASDDLTSDSFAGSIDEVLFYDRDLSPAEIATLMDPCATEAVPALPPVALVLLAMMVTMVGAVVPRPGTAYRL